MNREYQIIKNQSALDLLHGVSFKTTSTIRKWGNSEGLCIPKKCMDILQFESNQKVEICIIDDMICIKKMSRKKYNNLKERLEDFYQCPLEDIKAEKTEEVDWGVPEGDEEW